MQVLEVHLDDIGAGLPLAWRSETREGIETSGRVLDLFGIENDFLKRWGESR